MGDSGVTDGSVYTSALVDDAYEDPVQIYTGSDYDSSRDSAGTTTNNHTLSISGGIISRYVKIVCTFTAQAYGQSPAGSGSADVDLKIETAEDGGSFTSRFDSQVAATTSLASSGFGDTRVTTSIVFYYAPTEDEKTNGLDIKLTSTSTVGESGSSSIIASFANIQTVLLVY